MIMLLEINPKQKNTGKNFKRLVHSTQKNLNETAGFSQHEVKQLIELVLPKQNSDDILENIKNLYKFNG